MIEVSIIIPTRNRALELQNLLSSILLNDYESSLFEIIIVNNGSSDNTKEIFLAFENKIQNLIYHFEPEPGLLSARHAGLNISSGQILCFLDDDVELTRNYLNTLRSVFNEDSTLQLATGPSLPKFDEAPPHWLDFFWSEREEGKYCPWLSLIDFGNEIRNIHPNFVWGLNFCIRKSCLLSLGGFHPDCIPTELQKFQGDGETGLTLKAASRNITAKYFPNLAITHHITKDRLTTDYFKKRAFYQGVCESFTQIRSSHFQMESSPAPSKKSLRDHLHPYYRWIKIFIPKTKNRKPKEVMELAQMLESEEKLGFAFHQECFLKDDVVKQWVLKSDYLNFKLPSND